MAQFGYLLNILLVQVAIFLPEQDSLAYLATAGDNYNAEILRDSWGVPHIFGRTDKESQPGMKPTFTVRRA